MRGVGPVTTRGKASAMNKGLSLYFDLLRAGAAFEVFLFHMNRFKQIGMKPAWWNYGGFDAVTLFFVLSGFVIAFAARERDRTLERYVVSRLTRILSVAVPAVFLTYLADRIGHPLDPLLYAPFTLDYPIVRLIAGMTLLNESWVPIQIFSNTPMWSVGYEFWYYFLFAAIIFLRGPLRIAAVVVVALISGPRALLLFPIWLMGSWAYRERWSATLPRAAHVLLALVPLVGMWMYYHYNWRQHGVNVLLSIMTQQQWRQDLTWSRYVLSDTAFGALIACHFVGMRNLGPELERVLGSVARPVRFVAAYSFTLYALHNPMLLLSTAVIGAAGLPVSPWSVGGLTLAVVLVVGTITERRRYRLKPIFAGLLARIAPPRILAATA